MVADRADAGRVAPDAGRLAALQRCARGVGCGGSAAAVFISPALSSCPSASIDSCCRLVSASAASRSSTISRSVSICPSASFNCTSRTAASWPAAAAAAAAAFL